MIRSLQLASLATEVSSDDAKIDQFGSRIAGLEGIAKEYKTHTHFLPVGFGSVQSWNQLMVTANTTKLFSRPTSGPEQH